jgi:hypothetical protein
MSFVNVAPEMVASAAQDLAGIRSALGDVTAAAAGPTTAVAAAGQDEVSAAVSALFGGFGEEFQVLSAQAQAFHEQFVALLNAGAEAYIGAEAAATQTLQSALNAAPAAVEAIAAPYQSLVVNTVANLQGIGDIFVGNTLPALQQAITGGIGQVGQVPAALVAAATGDPLPLQAIAGNIEGSYANLAHALNPQGVVSAISATSSNVALADVSPIPGLLAWDLLGAPVNGFSASLESGAAFLNALQTGNPIAAMTTLIDAPANITNAFLNGTRVMTFGLDPSGFVTLPGPLPQEGTLSLFFNGLLAPPQPFLGAGTLVDGAISQPYTITGGPLFGGFISGLLGAPQLLVSGFPGF